MLDITRVIYNNEAFHHPEAQRLFEPVPLHEVPRLVRGNIIWVDDELAAKVYAFEKARITNVINTDAELAVVCTGLKSGTLFRCQVKSMCSTRLFRLKNMAMLTELVSQEPRLIDPRLQAAA